MPLLRRSYVVRQSYLELYLAVRAGDCDVGITAAELDWRRSTCDANCSAVPPNFSVQMQDVDYTLGWTPALAAMDCCLAYGAPYYTSGFGLLSAKVSRSMDVQAALLSPHVINSALVLFIMLLIVCFVIHAVELLGGASFGLAAYPCFASTLYWGVVTMTSVGFGDVVATSPAGRFITALWSVASYVAISSLVSVITSLLTANVLSANVVDTLADVTAGMCVESQYPLLAEFVQRSPDAPSVVIFAHIGDCVAALLNGTVQAVLGERPILSWYMSAYNLPSLYLSPTVHPNPLAFVYTNGSQLMNYVSPAVTAATTNPLYVAQSQSIEDTYFAAPPRVRSAVEHSTVHTSLIAAAAALAALGLITHFAQLYGAFAALARTSAGAAAGRALAPLRKALDNLDARAEASTHNAGAPLDPSSVKRRISWLAAAAEQHNGGGDGGGDGDTQRVAAAALSLLEEVRAMSAAQAEAARAAAQRADALQARIEALLARDGGAAELALLSGALTGAALAPPSPSHSPAGVTFTARARMLMAESAKGAADGRPQQGALV